MQMSKSFLLITVGLASTSLQAQTLTRDNGAPVGDNQNSITAGENGSVFLSELYTLVARVRTVNLLRLAILVI